MRLNILTRFPHPVLEEDSDDYSNGNFAIDFEIAECKSTGNIRMQYDVKLDQEDIASLVDEDRASIIIFVESLRTYYNQKHNISTAKGELLFSKGELRGKVKIRPYIVTNQDINDFECNEIHPEFGGQAWDFRRSDVLAVAPEVTIDVGLEKLSPMESIFDLSINEDVPEGRTRVLLEKPRITIIACKKTVEGLNRLRTSSFGKLALLNGVYLPILMQVLDALKSGGEIYKEHRWYSVFESTCTHLDIEIDDPKLLEDAQTLFKIPLGRFLEAKEFKL